MKTTCLRCMARAMMGLGAAVISPAVFAQSYPARPIEVIVHTSPGSGGDIVS